MGKFIKIGLSVVVVAVLAIAAIVAPRLIRAKPTASALIAPTTSGVFAIVRDGGNIKEYPQLVQGGQLQVHFPDVHILINSTNDQRALRVLCLGPDKSTRVLEQGLLRCDWNFAEYGLLPCFLEKGKMYSVEVSGHDYGVVEYIGFVPLE